MADAVPLNIAQQAVFTVPAGAGEQTVQALPVTLLEAPQGFAEIARPVQINGSLLQLLSNGQITLRTAAGEFSLALTGVQNLPATPAGETIRQSLTELLTPLLGAAKTVTLILRPAPEGEAKPQIFLIVPKSKGEIELQAPKLAPEPITSAAKDSPPPSSEGKRLSVTILPKEAEKSLVLLFGNETQGPAAPLGDKGQPSLLESFVQKALQGAQDRLAFLSETGSEKAKPQQPTVLPQPENKAPSSPQALPDKTAQDVTLRLDRVLAPKVDWPETLAPDQIKATVIGKSASGHMVLSGADKAFFVQDEMAELPPGTKVIATVLPRMREDGEKPLPLPIEKDFASLRELVAALGTIRPEAAESFLQLRVPNPAHHMGATILFFLSALKSGQIEEWIGKPNLFRLEKDGKRHLIQKLSSDIEEATTPAKDSRIGEWRSWPLPLCAGQHYEMLRLYVHEDFSRQEKESGAGKPDAKTRFLITMNMTQLGAMQMDGLSQNKRLDLVIRSERLLPQTLPDELRGIYIRTLEALGLTGTIGFQTGQKDWVTVGTASKAVKSTYA